MQKPGHEKNSGRPWTRTFSWPRAGSVKPYSDSKNALSQGVLGLGGEMLTWTEDFVEWWKDHYLLNTPTMSSFEVAAAVNEHYTDHQIMITALF